MKETKEALDKFFKSNKQLMRVLAKELKQGTLPPQVVIALIPAARDAAILTDVLEAQQ